MRVLIVEDDESTVSFITTGLAGSGYDIECSDNGSEALVRPETNRYDVVILDRMLPGLDGPGVLKHIRAPLARRRSRHDDAELWPT